jgi:DNA repair protein RecO (recombination protein O)
VERFDDLAIVLKTMPYQERDRIAVCLTENHGRVTGLAKGAVHSRRYGGSLDFLACSRVKAVQKPHAEMARIEEAVVHHEFANLHRDFERLTAASFAAEFCTRLLEPRTPSREMFIVLSNALFQLDAGMAPLPAVNAFLCKSYQALGYRPSLLRCVRCGSGAHEILEKHDNAFFWDKGAGGMVCAGCFGGRDAAAERLDSETLLRFQRLTTAPFKELAPEGALEADGPLYRVLADFLHHHIPGLPAAGMKSWRLLNDAINPS